MMGTLNRALQKGNLSECIAQDALLENLMHGYRSIIGTGKVAFCEIFFGVKPCFVIGPSGALLGL